MSLPKCKVKYCRRYVLPTEKSPMCSRHRRLACKEKNPLRYFFKKLRDRAKERGKEFTLTFEEYCKFACETGYDQLVNRGKTAASLSIHRKIETEGYHAWNIQAVSLSMNARLKFAPIPESYRQQILAEAAAGCTGERGMLPSSPPKIQGITPLRHS
jgi:hypothetical protein